MHRATRSIGFVFALLTAATVAANGLFALGRAVHPEALGTNLMVMATMPQTLRILRAHSRNPETYTVAFMGDSTVVAYPEGQTLDERLQQALTMHWSGSGRPWVASLSSMGMTPAGFFLLEDEIRDARPDVAIVTANLPLFREPLPSNLKRPEFAGWVWWNRIYDTLVALDLYESGVTADRLLLYKLFVVSGRTIDWLIQTERQARLGHLREAAEEVVAAETGWRGEVTTHLQVRLRSRDKLFLPGEPGRATSFAAELKFGEVMAGIESDHWAMKVLQCLLDDFADAGIATVLYIPPINLEHLKSIGVYDEAGLSRSLETLERIARHSGAELADLHDLLPDAAFRDDGGHLTYAPPYDGPALVAEALAPYVLVQTRAVARAR